MAATFQVNAPEPFSFNRPGEWLKWSRWFERFRVASGLADKGESAQVNTLIYAMGDKADDILRSFLGALRTGSSHNQPNINTLFGYQYLSDSMIV